MAESLPPRSRKLPSRWQETSSCFGLQLSPGRPVSSSLDRVACLTHLRRHLEFPPLQRTQGRGTHCVDNAGGVKAWDTRPQAFRTPALAKYARTGTRFSVTTARSKAWATRPSPLPEPTPPSRRRPPSPLDFYLSWMSPLFVPHLSRIYRPRIYRPHLSSPHLSPPHFPHLERLWPWFPS
jgi:hypothetical protein